MKGYSLFPKAPALLEPHHQVIAPSDETVEYTNNFSAEAKNSSNECPGYDTKQSDGQVPVILELWRMWSAPSLPLIPGSTW